ncbi:fatty-acid amide hydrolase 1-like isoform X2 [Corapipo altera]|uniref:fatty-acid amide hydrolase 1-like isoform X2 n=1 Tax=Corapipo altera TaxID=415028 RepID=UPI000FD647E4|nr:fatty-acid amide hydrolase 1-like isoform X2 [Corapipo altera]
MIQKRMEEAQKTRHEGLKKMAKAVQQFREQVYCSEFITQWKELHLDVVLCPVLGPAFTTGYPGKLFTAISSTMLYNILNFPAGVVPVSTVTEADEEELELFQGC